MELTNVLLLEKKEYLRNFIITLLKTQGCFCKTIETVENIKENFEVDLNNFHIFILNLDYFDQLFPRFRLSDQPVIPLPPTLGLTDKISEYRAIDAINRGLDDCVTYPLNKELFLARIKSLARRPKIYKTSQYQIGNFQIIRDSNELVYKTKKINLSKKEYLLLSLLLENPNRIISKQEMIKRVWITGKAPGINTIDVHVCNIRKKLRLNQNNTIHTVHGLGYKIKV